MRNRRWFLAARPRGVPQPNDWRLSEEQIGAPAKGEFLARNLYINIEPGMRGWLREARAEIPSPIPSIPMGGLMRALTIAQVIESRHSEYPQGAFVSGPLGMQEFAISTGQGVERIEPAAPLELYHTLFGMAGMAAYFSLLEVGRARTGETVVLSGAAGTVGSIGAQIARNTGCRVIGIAGGAAKRKFIEDELGIEAIDYEAENCAAALHRLCPDGVDVFVDTVGGEVLDAVLLNLARHARIVICGAISQYNSSVPRGPVNYMNLNTSRATMCGFVVYDHAPSYAQALEKIFEWYRAGQIVSRQDVVEGIERFPEVFARLFDGTHIGKLILKVA
ncbi:MAG: NADP-dependent oxidoreductase [Steroidobacteraceae bacterium]